MQTTTTTPGPARRASRRASSATGRPPSTCAAVVSRPDPVPQHAGLPAHAGGHREERAGGCWAREGRQFRQRAMGHRRHGPVSWQASSTAATSCISHDLSRPLLRATSRPSHPAPVATPWNRRQASAHATRSQPKRYPATASRSSSGRQQTADRVRPCFMYVIVERAKGENRLVLRYFMTRMTRRTKFRTGPPSFVLEVDLWS